MREGRAVAAPTGRVLVVLMLALAAGPHPAAAQTLTGRVLEEGRRRPVPGAVISLVDTGGRHRAGATTDSLGRFELVPPGAGEYVVEVRRLGYRPTRSALLALSAAGSVPVEILLQPLPIGLEGFEVTVERRAEELLRNFGLTPAALGRRWIDRAAMESMPLPPGPREVIRWQAIPGVWLDERDPLCLSFARRPRSGCALILWNGVPVSQGEAQSLSPEEIEAIAILTPVDATTFYGTKGGAGAILIWGRQGGRR